MKKIFLMLSIVPALYFWNPSLQFNIVEAGQQLPQAQTTAVHFHK